MELFVKNNWDSRLFQGMANNMTTSFNTSNKGKCILKVVSPKKGPNFILKLNGLGGTLPTGETLGKGKASKAKRKRKREDQVEANNENTHLSIDECVSDIKARIRNSLSTDVNALSVDSFTCDKLPITLSLARESCLQSQLWLSHFPNVQFSPSLGCFETFQVPPEVLEARISTLLKRKTVLTINDLASRPKQSPSTEVPEKEASSTSTEADVPQFT
jgi:hypothetical protein